MDTLNFANKTGLYVNDEQRRVITGHGSDERWCMLDRFNADGSFERLFIARFKYMKAASKAKAYCKKLVNDLGADSLMTIDQAGLDAYRASINEQERIAFMIREYGTADTLAAGKIAAARHDMNRLLKAAA